eukprot:scaffold20355_cov31-Tisochrysis_lutea.AAC.4
MEHQGRERDEYLKVARTLRQLPAALRCIKERAARRIAGSHVAPIHQAQQVSEWCAPIARAFSMPLLLQAELQDSPWRIPGVVRPADSLHCFGCGERGRLAYACRHHFYRGWRCRQSRGPPRSRARLGPWWTRQTHVEFGQRYRSCRPTRATRKGARHQTRRRALQYPEASLPHSRASGTPRATKNALVHSPIDHARAAWALDHLSRHYL